MRRLSILALLIILVLIVWPCWTLLCQGATVNLAWDASTSPEVTGYRIYQGPASAVYDVNYDAGNQLAFIVPNLSDGTYYFAATAYSPDAESNYSNEVFITIAQAPDTTPPTAPGTPTVTPVSSAQLNLSWTAATDNVGVVGYRIERCQDAGCSNFTEIAQPTGTTYSSTGLAAGTLYRYRGRAADAAGNLGPYSGIGEGVTQATGSGPVAAYAFDVGSGTTAADASGNTNTGTLNAATWGAGHTSNAVYFNGTSAYVSVPHAAILSLAATGTLETWVYLDALNRWHGVMAKGTANSDQAHNYAMEITNANVVTCVLGTGAASSTLVGTTVLPVNTWVHVACTWDGTTQRLYINGAQGATKAQTVTPVANTAPLALGRFDGGFDFLAGRLDDVRIYSRALSLAEIQTDMNTPVGGGTVPPQVTGVQVNVLP